jgi:hypothetical protein
LKTSPEPLTRKEKLADKPVNLGPERRKASVQEERKRGQRLFGGLLSTLSQTTPNSQQKRRQEIEKRQQEKAKQQKAEDEKRRAQKREDLVATRKSEQVKFEEASVCTFTATYPTHTDDELDADTTYQYSCNGTFPMYEERTENCKIAFPIIIGP